MSCGTFPETKQQKPLKIGLSRAPKEDRYHLPSNEIGKLAGFVSGMGNTTLNQKDPIKGFFATESKGCLLLFLRLRPCSGLPG